MTDNRDKIKQLVDIELYYKTMLVMIELHIESFFVAIKDYLFYDMQIIIAFGEKEHNFL